ncbi:MULTISPECIES: amino acid ABC transporter permease [Cellulomonas]|jgi:polar amino acid transport system permease protein|uniref:Polar amino acid transport system permease protein n=1 Tax=Cellulomonas iranensis TaxID=76862 RepID=A0ABU0GF29_9CELL|nr:MULTISPECIES: amino acid ABC transporter permease [Cellulomonas]MDQ0423913.1 polar amino acid transport system permease protein [Cellulomonas iranensis]TFH72729.1 amino acid ABC transporter permease [Cellulomonas sp. HD19AZ1]UCN13472.1 amino acid ABC transporter permease [Cellulomonas iranensis]
MTTAPQTLQMPPGRRRTSPRTRARLTRAVQYVVLAAALLAVAFLTDWSKVGEQLFDPTVAADLASRMPRGLWNTVRYTLGAFAVGLPLGAVLALMKLSSVAPYRWIATAYIEFFRGIPALLVVLSVGFAVPIAFGVNIPSMLAKASIALGVVSAAYIAETLRAGIEAVPKGQVEAARSLGMSHGRTLAQVVVPQAFRIVLPPMTNEIILLTKDTSLVFLLGMLVTEYDLTKIGRDALNSAQGGLTALFVAGACYLLITLPLGQLTRWLERRTSTKGRGK